MIPQRECVCRPWLDAVGSGDARFGISPLALSAVVRITTDRRIYLKTSPSEEALRFCDNLLGQPNCQIVEPGERHWTIFKRLCLETGTRGPGVTDAWFAALAIEWGCEWVTMDRDYARFPGLRWAPPRRPPRGRTAARPRCPPCLDYFDAFRPALLRAPDFEPELLRDGEVARLAAERVFAPDFVARFADDFAPVLRAVEALLERLVEEPFAADFLAPDRFDAALPPRAAERELFAPDLRDAADFFAPLLRALLPALFFALLLRALLFEPEPPFLPPPSCLLTVAQARRSASSSDRPRSS